MIRRDSPAAFRMKRETEAALRIRALYETYGEAAFIQYFSDENGSYMSLMDGTAVLDMAGVPTEEWIAFLQMNPDIRVVRTYAAAGEQIAAAAGAACRSGIYMRYDAGAYSSSLVTIASLSSLPSLEKVYDVLAVCFEKLPPFEPWYVDMSHRLRHGHGHIATICVEENPVSVACTVAETSSASLLGGVATLPDWRKRGYAGQCICALLAAMRNKKCYISPVDSYAATLYHQLGFRECGSWAEVQIGDPKR